ncbi:MAG: nucleotide sugar dehydrogenase [Candidatus Dependentiae bacterium]|nr:nucleotide sugar dehydrogenase [Candidatus Dependentiae bacterium]
MKQFKTFYLVLSAVFFMAINAQQKITVIGLGRLGLCMSLAFERSGAQVCGIDLASRYIESLNAKSFNSAEPHVEAYLQESKSFYATISLEEGLIFSDLILIIIDTPNGTNEPYDHSKLNKLLSNINVHKVKNKHIVICCTVFPGYIKNIATELLCDCDNISISYNPEFIAQGSIIHDFEHPDIILIGEGSKEAGDRLEALYRAMCKNEPYIARMSSASAEITKLAVNCFLTTKIAYANMVGDIADSTKGADKYAILNAVGHDSRIGSKYLKPGYGFGGPCFPRDNRALGIYAEKIGIEPLIPYATDIANKSHAKQMAQILMQEKKETYVFEDVNYKDNCLVVIIEESQKLAVAEILAKAGNRVVIRDRAVVIKAVKEKYGSLFEYEEI